MHGLGSVGVVNFVFFSFLQTVVELEDKYLSKKYLIFQRGWNTMFISYETEQFPRDKFFLSEKNIISFTRSPLVWWYNVCFVLKVGPTVFCIIIS
jgi:hypothetical protein